MAISKGMIGSTGGTGSRLMLAALLVLAAAAFGGCAGGAHGGSPPAPAPSPSDPPPPAVDSGVHNVTFTTRGGPFYVDKLELEFNRRRNLHLFFGFWPDEWSRMVQVEWAELSRVDFLGPMPAPLFEQAVLGREDQDLRADQAFELRLEYRDGRTATFYALVPKFRGEKDFQLWEHSMSGNPMGIEYIEFNR